MSWERFGPRRLRFWTLSILIIMILAFSTLPVTAASTGEIVQTIHVGKYEIVEENDLHDIQMNSSDYKNLESAGDPAIPEKILEVQVPATIDWSTLRLRVENIETSTLSGKFLTVILALFLNQKCLKFTESIL